MKIDNNLIVTVSKHVKGITQVFGTNKEDRFVFGVREFLSRKEANQYAGILANRWSCSIETP